MPLSPLHIGVESGDQNFRIKILDFISCHGPTSRCLMLYREDGERAIRTLNGYGYGHLILKVEWAAPREARG